MAQFRTLTARVQQMERPTQDRNLHPEDLTRLGYDLLSAEHITSLLSQETLLDTYLRKGSLQDCHPITRLTPGYPLRLRKLLDTDAPGVLWAKGDASVLQTPAVALVGSRELNAPNQAFAAEVGRQAALQGFTLISGNARGADITAQESCLAHGGNVISIVADRLERCPIRRNILYLSEDGFDLNFTAHRALSRNRVIHCLGVGVFVAQVRLRKGGTWSGTAKNLSCKWSPVFCFEDGSAGTQKLLQMGAAAVTGESLADLSGLITNSMYENDQ